MMHNNLKKITKSDLEEYVLNWVIERIEHIQLVMEEIQLDVSITDEDEKEFICAGLASDLAVFLELLQPLKYENESSIDWAKEFVKNHYRPNYDEN